MYVLPEILVKIVHENKSLHNVQPFIMYFRLYSYGN